MGRGGGKLRTDRATCCRAAEARRAPDTVAKRAAASADWSPPPRPSLEPRSRPRSDQGEPNPSRNVRGSRDSPAPRIRMPSRPDDAACANGRKRKARPDRRVDCGRTVCDRAETRALRVHAEVEPNESLVDLGHPMSVSSRPIGATPPSDLLPRTSQRRAPSLRATRRASLHALRVASRPSRKLDPKPFGLRAGPRFGLALDTESVERQPRAESWRLLSIDCSSVYAPCGAKSASSSETSAGHSAALTGAGMTTFTTQGMSDFLGCPGHAPAVPEIAAGFY
jgi:hypothetical protein